MAPMLESALASPAMAEELINLSEPKTVQKEDTVTDLYRARHIAGCQHMRRKVLLGRWGWPLFIHCCPSSQNRYLILQLESCGF